MATSLSFDTKSYNPNYNEGLSTAPKKKKGPGGLAGFLVNSLPAIGSGIGAVGGSFVAPVAGTVAGGTAGGALGEAIKRKLLGESLDPTQIAVQGLEGGALAGVGGVGRGVTSVAKGIVSGAAKTATKDVAETAATKSAGKSFLKNLTTQGQQMQGRVTGVSAGSKVAGKELTPQDTEQMLKTLENHGVTTGNANNTLRDVTDKLKGYGQQISGHFKAGNASLKLEDTKVIADNFIKGLDTTDPNVLQHATVLANDLQKNVKSTEDLWKFRKTLDSRIPDTKFMDENTSNKVTALKSMREYISKELGSVPGMKEYHELSGIKPFVSAEAKRLNNPGGGIVGRVLSSGVAQKTESLAGKGVEKVGKAGAGSPPPVNPVVGSTEAVAASNPGFMDRLVRAPAAPIAYPGKTAAAVLKQEAGRGFGIPAAGSQPQQQPSDGQPASNFSSTILQSSSNNPTPSDSPYDPVNAEANVRAILEQGGTDKDVAAYLSNVKQFQALQATGVSPAYSKPSAQQHALAQSAVGSLQQLAQMIEQDPSIINKNATPGQGTPIVGSLVTNAAGAGGYHSLADNILSSLIHLQTGATATKEEIISAHGQLPQPGDSSEERQRKIQTLLSNFEPFLQGQ